MQTPRNIDVLFVAGFGPIVRDLAASRQFYAEGLGLPLTVGSNGCMHARELEGVKHSALWPLAQAAESCFGADRWPEDVPAPQAWIEFDVTEFDVADIKAATTELRSQGYQLLVAMRKEPWGQTVN